MTLTGLATSTILPGWVVLPVAGLTLLIVAGHILATHASELPLRRRRLRVVNGLLMMFVVTLLAYALGVAGTVESPAQRPAEARSFVTIWLLIVGLLGIVVALASADAAATVLGGVAARRQLRRQMRRDLSSDLRARRAAGRR